MFFGPLQLESQQDEKSAHEQMVGILLLLLKNSIVFSSLVTSSDFFPSQKRPAIDDACLIERGI